MRRALAGIVLLAATACRPETPAVQQSSPAAQTTNQAAAIRDSLKRAPAGFVAETTLVAFIERSLREWSGDDNTRAELAYLRLRALDRVAHLPEVAAFNPNYSAPGAPQPPAGLRGWTEARSSDLLFSELGMSWFVPSDVFWRLHDRFAAAPVADEAAWAAARAGLGGECEGYAGCYLVALLQMSGRYVETHPAGHHRAEALEVVRSQLVQMDQLEPARPLCGEDDAAQGVRPADLQKMRQVLEKAAAIDTTNVNAALTALERLEERCKQPR
jgi:hypothetical protein